jgi:mannan endo-1,4-beta-mannosidase
MRKLWFLDNHPSPISIVHPRAQSASRWLLLVLASAHLSFFARAETAEAQSSASNEQSPQPSAASDELLTRRGRALYYGGKPYVALGINAFGMAGCETGRPYSDEQMDAFFGTLRPHGLTRSWAFETQGMAGIERMVHWAEQHSQLLILAFADGRGYCGETDGRKGGEGSGKTDDWYKSGYKQRYLSWLEQVVARFKDSKAIGMWELINEPGDTDDRTMRAFFDDAAAHVKAIDPKHLVLSGSQAEYVRGTSDYTYIHEGPNVDVASLHEYDYDYNKARTIVSPHLSPTLEAMRKLDKPLIVGETGIQAGDGANCTNFSVRRDAVKQKFDSYLAQDGVVGVMVWSWVPNERQGCSLESFPDDPLMSMIRTYP